METLHTLHFAHLSEVPYENLDIMAGLPFNLDEDALFEKIVLRRRGGFCYELNILFARLLRELGFKVDILAAWIAKEDGSFGPEFDHPVLLVTLKERWLADVGNSKWFHLPLQLDDDRPRNRNGTIYQLGREGDYYVLFQQDTKGHLVPQYRFTLQPRKGAEFNNICHQRWTSPDSRFTQGVICSRLTPEGRIMLTKNRFVLLTEDGRTEQILNNEAEFVALLEEYFGTQSGSTYEPGQILDSPRRRQVE
jgi:N-hydroxyarylamine O-acetyltransferase